jgi:hypothetical protein
MQANRLLRTLRRSVVCLALLGLVALPASASIGSAGPKPVITSINALAGTGSQVAFEGTMGPKETPLIELGTEGLWSQRFGSKKLKLLASAAALGFCSSDASWVILSIAPGPKGSVGCLAVSGGISETDVAVVFVDASGTTRNVASASYSGGAEDSTPGIRPGLVPAIFGDGHFLGYLEIEPGGVVSLFKITSSGKSEYVADLPGLSSCGDQSNTCGDAGVDSGNIFVRKSGDSKVRIFTTAGEPVASFDINVSPRFPGAIAIRKNRIVALTANGKLAVYTLHGALVHSYSVRSGWGDISTYYGFVAYLGTGRSVRVLKLSTGKSRKIVALPSHSYGFTRGRTFNLQQSGLVVALTGGTHFVYVPWKKIRAKFR